MDQNEELQLNELEKWADIDCDNVDFDALEEKLEADLEEQLGDLKFLEEEHEKIGNPDTIGDVVLDVVWEQFINQIGVVAGEDFIEENRGLRLDLRDSAHIQTVKNFTNGKLAEHNHISHKELEQNYDRYKNTSHSEYRRAYVNPGMNATLERAGSLHNAGIETVRDIYTGRQIPTKKTLEDGSQNPLAAQREHVRSSSELYQHESLQMSYDNENLAAIINNPENLQGYTTAERNNRKSDNTPEEMEVYDKNKHWEKANQRAEEFVKAKENEGEERLKKEGRQTQKEEAFKIRDKALRAVIMGLFASLIKDIVQKLVSWFRSGERKFKSFITSVTDAIKVFISNIKQHLKTATNTFVTTVTSAIFGPIIGMLKKAWIFLKQGWKSLKEAVAFLRNPENKQLPFSMKMLQVGKIVIAGLTAGGAILLGEVIEKALMTIPVFAIEIPFLGSIANLLGIFLGALVSGVIGALALNLIDRRISHKLKKQNLSQQHNQRNEILQTQEALLAVSGIQLNKLKAHTAQEIVERHTEAANKAQESEEIHKQTRESLNEVFDILNEV